MTQVSIPLIKGQLTGRNKFTGGEFKTWSGGVTLNNVQHEDELSENVFYITDGTSQTVDVSRQDFDFGQNVVLGHPKYYLRFDQSVVDGGATFNILRFVIEDVEILSDELGVLGIFIQSDTATSIGTRFIQYFGTGGSPSSDVITNGGSLVVDTSWKRQFSVVTIPTVSGQTPGSNNDTKLYVELLLPNIIQITDISLCQVESGNIPSDFQSISTNQSSLTVGGLDGEVLLSDGASGIQTSEAFYFDINTEILTVEGGISVDTTDVLDVRSVKYVMMTSSTPLTPTDTLQFNNDITVLTLNNDQDITTFTGVAGSERRDFVLIIKQNGTGGYSITSWPSSVVWSDNQSAPLLPQDPNTFIMIRFITDGTTFYGAPIRRSTKSILKSSLTTGTGAAYTLTNLDLPVLVDGDIIAVKFHTTNTIDLPTLNVNGAGALSVSMRNGGDLLTGFISDYSSTGYIYFLQRDVSTYGGFIVIKSSGLGSYDRVVVSGTPTIVNFSTAKVRTNELALACHQVFRNGQLQLEGALYDYQVTGGAQITFNSNLSDTDKIDLYQLF